MKFVGDNKGECSAGLGAVMLRKGGIRYWGLGGFCIGWEGGFILTVCVTLAGD